MPPLPESNLRTHPHLFVPETICRSIETHHIQGVRLVTSALAVENQAIAWLQRSGVHADCLEFPAVVQLAAPSGRLASILDVNDNERMRLNHRELDENTVEGNGAGAVVYRGYRVMTLGDDTAQDHCDGNRQWSAHVAAHLLLGLVPDDLDVRSQSRRRWLRVPGVLRGNLPGARDLVGSLACFLGSLNRRGKVVI